MKPQRQFRQEHPVVEREGENLGLWMHLVQRLEFGPDLFCSHVMEVALGILCAELPELSEALARPKDQIIHLK